MNHKKKELEFCTTCPKLCRFACPVANAEYRESVTPWGKVSMLYYLSKNYVAHTTENYDLMYHCTGCLMCREFCEHQISVSDLLISGRNRAYDKSRHNRKLDKSLSNIKNYGSIFSDNLQENLNASFDSIYFSSHLKVVIFAGCLYSSKQIETLKKTIYILEQLGVDYTGVYNHPEICCGYPLYFSGFHKEFSSYIKKVKRNLSGKKKIIALCPACAYTLKALYPQFDQSLSQQVLTFSEFILPYMRATSRNRKKKTEHYVYHDPCFMSRYLKITEEPREIIRSTGAILSEFLWNRNNSICCGGGSMFKSTNPEVALDIAKKRIEEYNATGAKAIITSCPSCIKIFKESELDVQTLDLIDIVYDFLKEK